MNNSQSEKSVNPYYTRKKGIVLSLVWILSLGSYVSAQQFDSSQAGDSLYAHLATKIVNTSIVNNADTLALHPDLPQPLARKLRASFLAKDDLIVQNAVKQNHHTPMLSAFITRNNSARVEKSRVTRTFSGTMEVLLLKPDGTILEQEVAEYRFEDSVPLEEFELWQRENQDPLMEFADVEQSGIDAWSDVALPTLIITSIAVTVALLFTVRGS